MSTNSDGDLFPPIGAGLFGSAAALDLAYCQPKSGYISRHFPRQRNDGSNITYWSQDTFLDIFPRQINDGSNITHCSQDTFLDISLDREMMVVTLHTGVRIYF